LKQLVRENTFEDLGGRDADKLDDWHVEAIALYLPLKNIHIDGSSMKVFETDYYSTCSITFGLSLHLTNL
jgi:hypothetical protein